MVIHHGFDEPGELEMHKAWPIRDTRDWCGMWCSQIPLNACFQVCDGTGANNTTGYVALPGAHASQFYFEVTPRWQRPRQCLDLRSTRVSLYLKSITPIHTNPGYDPHLFINYFDVETKKYNGWLFKEKLLVGEDWTYNQVDLRSDQGLWTRYSPPRRGIDLEFILSNVGFIGVMYFKDANPNGVDACGILGIDELRYNMPL